MSAFKKMCFGKGRCYRKKVETSKIGSQGLTSLKSVFTKSKFQTKVQCLLFLHVKFSCSDNITTATNSKTYWGLSTDVVSIFMRGGRKSDMTDILFYHEL